MRAIYAGSFDPPTVGHLDVIHRGAALCEQLVVAVGFNPAKRYWFDLEARCALLRAAIQADNVVVAPFEGLLIHAVAAHGAHAILRGIRSPADFELELRNALANRDLAGVETLLLPSDPRHVFVSSSLVKEIHTYGGDVSRYVPADVAAALAARRTT